MKKAIYSGTFDPITNGHSDIIERASTLFDEVVIAVAINREKKPMFSLEKRIEMIENIYKDNSKIKVIGFDTLLVDLSDKLEINTIIRGLRGVSDFEYELQMGYANKSIKKELETVYLMPSLSQSFVSSSIVRALLKYQGDISHLVPKEVANMLKDK